MGEVDFPLTSQPPGFNCARCGECCRRFSDKFCVMLFPRDITRLACGLGILESDVLTRYCKPKKLRLPELELSIQILNRCGDRCVFLEESGLCCVNDFKPVQCTRTPFSYFWDGHRRFECMREVALPDDWSSDSLDRDLVEDLVRSQQAKGGVNGCNGA